MSTEPEPDPEDTGITANTYSIFIRALREIENAPMPPDAERVLKSWPPKTEINLVGRPPMFIPYHWPAEIPESGHYSDADQPWLCGRCGIGIVAWASHQECVAGRFALPPHDAPELPPHETPELDV